MVAVLQAITSLQHCFDGLSDAAPLVPVLCSGVYAPCGIITQFFII